MAGANWKKAMVVLGDEGVEPAGASRIERFEAKRHFAEDKRMEILDTLEDAGLGAECEIQKAGPSPLLLVSGTERAIAAMKNTSAVEDVKPISDDVPIEIIS